MKKKKRLAGQLLIAILLLFLTIGAAGYFYYRSRPAEAAVMEEEQAADPYEVINIEIEDALGVPIIHNHAADDSPRRPGEIREVRYVVIHETDNRSAGADAQAHNAFLTGNDLDVTGWHYTVDDHEIYHNIPDNEIAWNAGDNRDRGGGNMNGIGVELCVNIDGDFAQTTENAAKLTAVLLDAYGLTPEDVRLHSDFMNKICPHRLISEGRVDEFKRMVKQYYEEIRDTSIPVESE